MTKIVALILCLGCLACPSAFALNSSVGLSVAGPVELPPSDYSIIGLRLSLLWGQHKNVYGMDLGLVGNISEQMFAGSAAALAFNYNQGAATVIGAQVAGLANITHENLNLYGLQLAGILNSNQGQVGSGLGVQLALVNLSPHLTLVGAQVGLYNVQRDTIGIQAGVINYSEFVHGIQIGLFNSTEDLHGLQIGLLNYNRQGIFAFSPILNVGF